MRGVVWKIAPDARIADLTWEITPQNVLEASLELDRQVFFFPDDSVHIIVVDPGVGTTRRPLAAKIGSQYFVAPDNGVLSMLLERAEREQWPIEIVHTDKPEYWLPKVSDIFHGRDIFSPVGAHLAAGVPLELLGGPIDDPVRIDIPFPQVTDEGVEGQITTIYTYFGNIITNIQRQDIAHLGDVDVTLCGTTIRGVVRTFGDRPPGTLVALFDECDYLYVAVVNGNAAERIHPKAGDKVVVRPR
jgi:S-adenosylmethionine hydrolase